jgi:hypothetical protein
MNQEYTLDNAWIQARERLSSLESDYDPTSIRHLERLGVSEGWHCLEVGAGGGIPRRLAEPESEQQRARPRH